MSTEEMVSRCIRKDKVAWNEFIRQHQSIVRKVVYYKLYKTSYRAPINDVDDIAQEVFLMLWEDNKLAQLRDISCLTGWLAIVTMNQMAVYRRKRNNIDRMTMSLSDRLSEDVTTTLEDVIPCKHPDPAQLVETKEAVSRLEESMANLRFITLRRRKKGKCKGGN